MKTRYLIATAVFLSSYIHCAQATSCWNDKETHIVDAPGFSPAEQNPAELLSASKRIEMIARNNPVLRDMPDVRGRIDRTIGGMSKGDNKARTLDVSVKLFLKEAWIKGECGIHPKADRIPQAFAAQVIFHVNDGTHFLTPLHSWNDPDTLPYFEEPKVLRKFQQFSAWGYANKDKVWTSGTILMTRNGRSPWVALSIGEYLDIREDGIRKLAEARAENLKSPSASLDPAKIQESYEALKKVNPKVAEEFKVKMDGQIREYKDPNSRVNKKAPGAAATNSEELLKVAQFRRDVGPGGLEQQVFINGTHPPAHYPLNLTTSNDTGTGLVKPDNTFAKEIKNRNRLHSITVEVIVKNPNGSRFSPTIVGDIMRAMDLEQLEALLR